MMTARDNNSFSVAMHHRIRVARQGKAFQDALAHAQTVATAYTMSGITSERLRELGGWTKIITDAFNEWAGDAVEPGPFGQPIPVRSLLTPADIADVRNWAIRMGR